MAIQLVKCPKCGSPMVKRNGKYGEFYGCSKYPSCRATVDPRDVVKQLKQQTAGPQKVFQPSPFQQAIFDFIKTGQGNAFVEAVAGSGKTTTMIQGVKLTSPTLKVLMVCFNVTIKDVMYEKVQAAGLRHVRVSTLHSLGFKALRNGLKVPPEVDDAKTMGIIKEFLPDYEKEGALRAPLAQLVGLAKNTLTDPEDLVALRTMADRYGVDMNGDADRLLGLVASVMAVDLQRTSVVDYDDMIWMPVRLNLHMETYDWMFVDECQDLNAAQIELVLRSVKPGTGRVVAVGDRHQSIYGFRGADVDAVPRLIDALNAQVLPLSITYRCPKNHVAMAQEIVPQIEAAPDAKDGMVEYTTYNKALVAFQDGDLALCRVNAPLISTCYTLIKLGRKAVIRGRDIGKNLINFIDKLQPTSIIDLMLKVDAYQLHETERLQAQGRESQIQSLGDKCECVRALCDGIRDLSELRQRISSIFDDETKTGVVLSSVHRAKGDEAQRVWILKPELMPHPMAQQDWERDQEENIRYVAYTRSLDTLIFVNG